MKRYFISFDLCNLTVPGLSNKNAIKQDEECYKFV